MHYTGSGGIYRCVQFLGAFKKINIPMVPTCTLGNLPEKVTRKDNLVDTFCFNKFNSKLLGVLAQAAHRPFQCNKCPPVARSQICMCMLLLQSLQRADWSMSQLLYPEYRDNWHSSAHAGYVGLHMCGGTTVGALAKLQSHTLLSMNCCKAFLCTCCPGSNNGTVYFE